MRISPRHSGSAGNRRPNAFARATEPLSSKAFRGVFISNMSFFLAMGGQGIVRPWLAFELTDSTFALALVSAAMAIPMFFLSPFGGVLADRVERRRLILLAQGFAILAESMPLVLLLMGKLEFWHLVLTASMMGCAFPLIMPARSAIIVNIVGRKALGSAMALNMTGVNVTRVVGPGLAGFLISVIDVEGVYFINLGLYLSALFAMFRVNRLPPPDGSKDHSVSKNLMEGFRYLRQNRLVLVLLVFGLVPQFLAMPFQTLLPAFARDVWNMGPTGFGILNAAAGIGAAVGSLFVAGRSPEAGRMRLMMLSVIAFGVLLSGFAQSPWFWPAVLLVFAANIFASTFTTLNNVAIQLVIPDEVRGRISSFLMMSVSLPLLGTLPIGALADRIGPPLAVGGASLMAAVLAVVFYFSSRNLRDLDAHVKRANHPD